MATFKTRARAVDMLGRQQIAGVPTAISELFKNAHDAYADRVEVDYYRSDRLFVLRDDGVGMTEEEFRSRWLTIGTESKLQTKTKLGPPPTDATKAPRPILGEKGIGRLAIAVIGPQVLILTQADRPGPAPDLVAAYVHWGFFEVPGVDLDEIEIPVETFSAHTPPSAADIGRMADTAQGTLDRIADRAGPETVRAIRGDLDVLRAVDAVEVESYIRGLDLRTTRGTHFILPGAYDTLEADIASKDGDEASPLEKLLLGFTNTMTPGHPRPAISTAFRDHPTDTVTVDLVDEERFFTPAEFANADHHIVGGFDEFGQFAGTVTVYGEPHNYRVAWPNAKGQPTKCGPFEIHLAVVQPQSQSTTLPPEEHQILRAKTNRMGGLYIYRDGIRILPYGDTDYDWLDIEKNRTKSASYYYFSHRNIFGAILLKSPQNVGLVEKAGREGFQEKTAYRQLRSMLENFLLSVAGDFFRKEGSRSDRWEERRAELKSQHEALKKREESVRRKRDRFKDALDTFFVAYDKEEPQKMAFELAERVERDLAEARDIKDAGDAAFRFIEIESRARAELRDLEASYRVVKPRGVGVARAVLRDYADYQDAYARLQEGVFAQVRDLIEGVVSQAAEQARVEIDRRFRIERALDELANQTRREARSERSETYETLDELRGEVREATKDTINTVESTVAGTLAEFASTDVSDLDDQAVVKLRNRLEHQILGVREQGGEFLRYLRAQIEAIDVSGDMSQLDQIEALEQRNIDLEARAEYDIELAQLGQAVSIINHEFDASVRAIRIHLRELKAWADINQGIDGVYAGLRDNFDHLDGYLTLFTPFDRRLNRKKVEISGSDIAKYVRDLFEPRFERHEIDLDVTMAFAKWSVTEYPSSFYPVFVNLLDNAVFWLDDRADHRTIRLDAEGASAYISNNGPSIPERRRELIFEQGTSFKPGGRGLGLFIAREVLRGIGYDLDLVSARTGMNVTFQILPTRDD